MFIGGKLAGCLTAKGQNQLISNNDTQIQKAMAKTKQPKKQTEKFKQHK